MTISGEQRVHPNMKPEIIAQVSIVSTGSDGQWYSSSGTSDSTVFVTGALALILQDQPQLRPSSTLEALASARLNKHSCECFKFDIRT